MWVCLFVWLHQHHLTPATNDTHGFLLDFLGLNPTIMHNDLELSVTHSSTFWDQ